MQATKTSRGLTYYKNGILNRDRVVLAQAITLIESTLPTDLEMAPQLIQEILPHSGNSIRIGITGAPGVGKSTFIESFGGIITDNGQKLAVLTIDPSSQNTRGSILGDKTRMEALSKNPNAFIRPSPSGATLGGVADKTRETVLLCEAAGFDVVIIETVGVGQSETYVKNMVDFFLLLLLPGGGDELQGIKKGIVEIADGLIITKADGDNINRAKQTQAEYQQAIHVLNPSSQKEAKVLITSSVTQEGISETWTHIQNFCADAKANNTFQLNRKKQNLDWFDEQFKSLLHYQLTRSLSFQNKIEELKSKISSSEISPTTAAVELLGFINQSSKIS